MYICTQIIPQTRNQVLKSQTAAMGIPCFQLEPQPQPLNLYLQAHNP